MKTPTPASTRGAGADEDAGERVAAPIVAGHLHDHLLLDLVSHLGRRGVGDEAAGARQLIDEFSGDRRATGLRIELDEAAVGVERTVDQGLQLVTA